MNITGKKNEKGLLFSMDLLCSFFGICLIALVSMECIANSVEANNRQLQEFELEKNAVMFMDAIVKNREPENPAMGATVFNEEKHRLEENVIDSTLLEKTIISEKNASLGKLSVEFKDGTKKTIIENSTVENCIGVERMVLIGGKKALLKGVVCSE